jgi:DNA/RNA endonuclease G (NUC1)
MKKLLLLLLLISIKATSQTLRDSVYVKTTIFEVVYSEVLEQPKWLIYKSINRPTNVNRGSMDFYTESTVRTSDSRDYYANIYDKGHLAPAATFSDNIENLKQTFSYLNCALQNQDMNRGEWRLLEEQERRWDNNENLTIKVELQFNPGTKLPTNATVPSAMIKHIYFEKQRKWKCYEFPNVKPTKSWEQHEVKHNH